MSSLRHFAELLRDAAAPAGAARVLAALGFADPLPLDATARAGLGIAGIAGRASVADGGPLIRVLLASAVRGTPARIAAARCATAVTARSPHLLWLVAVVQPAEHQFVIAVPPLSGESRTLALAVDTRRVQDSDAETLAAMADARGGGDALAYQRWRELLGRDALTRRFYRELERAVNDLAATAAGRAPDGARRELALLCASRLIFLAFLEAKGWLDGDRGFLRRVFDDRCAAGGGVHRKVLDPLFFGTLNTRPDRRAAAARKFGRVPFLNGGLFTRTPVERRWRDATFADAAIGRVVCDLLGRYRVTAREESTSWSEAAVDPEMLGRAFESLMASDERRESGAFYTPLAILDRVASAGMDEWLASVGMPDSVRTAAAAGEPIPRPARAALLEAIGKVRVLDPACGSGAFLVHMLEQLAHLRALAGDLRPVSARRREVLTRSIFGVDVNPMAVWLCELRLWLSVVIDAEDHDGMAVAPLPNLDHNIRVGDALGGAPFGRAGTLATGIAAQGTAPEKGSGAMRGAPCGTPQGDSRGLAGGRLSQLRARYVRASGPRKRTLARALESEERRLALAVAQTDLDVATARRRDLLLAARDRDLFARRITPPPDVRAELAALRDAQRAAQRRVAALRAGGALPFAFRVQFADVGADGGFHLVLGNPPWVRLHRIGPALRADFAARYRSWRDAAWRDGARDAHAARGFASQVDLAALFVERGLQVARPGGVVSFLVPAKLWTSLSAGGIRRVVGEEARVAVLEDWSESPAAFDAVVYPSLLVARKKESDGVPVQPVRGAVHRRDGVPVRPVRGAVHRREAVLAWETAFDRIPLDDSPGAPWLLLPHEVREAFDLLAARGTPLARTAFGPPQLGVKTGCNEAFVVTPRPGWRDAEQDHRAWPVRSGRREDDVERALLRPVLQGEHVRPWAAAADDRAIVWTHGPGGRPLDRLPPRAAAWLAPWRRALETRADAAHAGTHWTLFRTDAADDTRPRVVWSDISRVPRATVLAPGDPSVPLNTCYVAFAPTMADALALAALLNSAPAAAWLCALAEPARGGYRRFLGWTVARLPIPAQWDRAVRILAPLGESGLRGDAPAAHDLAAAAARAFGIRLSRLEPLMTWCLRSPT